MYEWEHFLEKGNFSLYTLSGRKLPPNIFLFHNARAEIVYRLVQKVVSQISLEEQILFKKSVTKLIGAHAKECCRSDLLSPDSVETLKSILQNFDLIIKDLEMDLNTEQLRKSLQKSFATL